MLQVNVANHCLNLVILECAGLSLLTDAGFIVSVYICVFCSARSSRNANVCLSVYPAMSRALNIYISGSDIEAFLLDMSQLL